MNVLGRILERLALIVLLIGGAGVLMAVFLGTGDVIGTQGFGQPIAGTRELTESTMVLIVFGALAYAQLGHLYPPGDRAIDRILRTALLILLQFAAALCSDFDVCTTRRYFAY